MMEMQNPQSPSEHQGQHPAMPRQQSVLQEAQDAVVVHHYRPAENCHCERIIEHFQGEKSKFLGKNQILLGCICIILNSVMIGLKMNLFEYFGYGIWNGALFIVSGVFCMIAGSQRTRLWITICMVACIISALSTANLFAFVMPAAILNGKIITPMIMNIAMALVAIMEAIAAIVASKVCCKTICPCCLPNEICVVQQLCDPAQQIPFSDYIQGFVMSQHAPPSVDSDVTMINPYSRITQNSMFPHTTSDTQDDQLLIASSDKINVEDTSPLPIYI